MPHVLIIDDEQAICSSLTFALEDEFIVEATTDPEEGLDWLNKKQFDICLLDLKLGSINGLDILATIKEEHPSVIVIMMTAYGSIASSVEALEQGAYYYLTKPLQMEELFSIMRKAVQILNLSKKVEHLSQELEEKYTFDEMVGKGFVMRNIFNLIDRVKDINTNVLVTGESGTGKELVVRAIHYGGNRKDEHLEVVNCSAIPEHLLESEMFGHEKGAFTGALQSRKGKFELAQNGTIFLDEIGDMPLSLQAKLLRVIEQREVVRLGSNEVIKLNVRLVAATNKNLKEAVKKGEFREDLYYRLNVIEITLPPLRERREDLPLLIDHFMNHFNKTLGTNIKELAPDVLKWLLNYDYPGNVRELANIIESAMVIARGDVIELTDLTQKYITRADIDEDLGLQNVDEAVNQLVGYTLKEIEEKMIIATLKHNNDHRKNTAEMLGISERGLRGKIQQYKEDGKIF